MKKLLILLLTLTLTSCFNKKSKTATPQQAQVNQGLTPEDFLNKLKIKVEVFKTNDTGSYLTDKQQDHQTWTVDSTDNFEGTWISESKTLGDWAFKYKFSLLEDGQLSLELETYKTILEHGVTSLGKHVAGPTYVFRHTRPISVPLDMFNRGSKSPTVSITPILNRL